MYVIKTRKCLEYRLNKEINRGRLLDVSGVQRRLGKTTLLYNIAQTMKMDGNNVIIVEPNKTLTGMFNREFNTDIFVSENRMLETCKTKLNFILVDEGLSPKSIKCLKHISGSLFLGGYYTKLYSTSDTKPLDSPIASEPPSTPIKIVDCNKCKWISITEEEQNDKSLDHMCIKFGIRVIHRCRIGIKSHSFIYPCDKCSGKYFEPYYQKELNGVDFFE